MDPLYTLSGFVVGGIVGLTGGFAHILVIQLDQLLQAAHRVDGIIKGLKQADWPASGWQSLHRLAMMLCQACRVPPAAQQRRARP